MQAYLFTICLLSETHLALSFLLSRKTQLWPCVGGGGGSV